MCQPYSMHVLHPLGWYVMERFLFHIHVWLSGSLSSTSIGECSWCPPLHKPLGSSSLGWPIWSSSSPGFGGFLFICCGVVLFFCWQWWWWLLESVSLFFSTPFHHHFSYFQCPDFYILITASSWCHHHSFWQIPPSLDIIQCQVIIEGLQLIAVGYRLPCGIP